MDTFSQDLSKKQDDIYFHNSQFLRFRQQGWPKMYQSIF